MALYQAQAKLERKFGRLIKKIRNGECKISGRADTPTADDMGFESTEYTGRTAEFIPCVWEHIQERTRDGDEQTVASSVRNAKRYKLTVPRIYEGERIEVRSSDRVQLKLQVGAATPVVLEVLSPGNVSNVHWELICVDVNSE